MKILFGDHIPHIVIWKLNMAGHELTLPIIIVKNIAYEFIYNIIDCWEFLCYVCHKKIQNFKNCTKLLYC